MTSRYLTFPTVFLFCVITNAVFGNTWYVDPVNGSTNYTGTSPFKVPYSNDGPAKEIAQVTWQANDYDIVVLMNGNYTGPQNTDPYIFLEIDFKSLYVVSAYGPENCKIGLEDTVTLNNRSYYDEVLTLFSGITFTLHTMHSNPRPYVRIANGSNVNFRNCVFTDFYSQTPFAILDISQASPIFKNCTFKNNHTLRLINASNASVKIENSVFTENENGPQDNGYELAIINANFQTNLILKNCPFTRSHFITSAML